MAALWELTHAGTTTKTLEEWGFEVAKRTLNSMTADTVDLELVPDDASDATEPDSASPQWVFGDSITIQRNGSPWFAGRLSPATRSATTDHVIGWTVLGPWQDLEEIQYFQLFGTTFEDTGQEPPVAAIRHIERGDVTLMQRFNTSTGLVSVIKTGQQIFDLLQFARTRTPTATFNLGTVINGFFVDFVEARDETVADLVRKLARWHPRASVWFDYTQSPPVINFTETGPVYSIEYDDLDSGETGINLRSDEDLQVPYVRIDYKTINNVDVDGVSSSYIDTAPDIFPADAHMGSDHRRALRATVDLAGSEQDVQRQKVETRPLPGSDDGSTTDPTAPPLPPGSIPGSGDNWRDAVRLLLQQDEYLPWLKDIAPTGDVNSNIGIKQFTISRSDPTDLDADPNNPGEVIPPNETEAQMFDRWRLWDTPRLLREGSTTEEWMGVKTQQVKVDVKLVFKGASRKGRNVRKFFTGRDFDGKPVWEGTFTLTATDSVTKVYRRTTSGQFAEEAPEGIAQRLYQDLAILKHTGNLTFTNDDILATGEWRPGQVFEILNSSNPAWDEMAVQAQRITEDIPNGITTVSVGSPNQLGLNDFITLARLWKANPPKFTDDRQRAEGDASSGASELEGGEKMPKSINIPRITLIDPLTVSLTTEDDDPALVVKIEPAHIDTTRLEDGALVPPFMVKIGNDDLTADPSPSLMMPDDAMRSVYLEATFDSEGMLTKVEAKIGTELPADESGADGSEFRLIAELDTTVDPAIVDQKVEGGFTWPGKPEAEGGPTSGAVFVPQYQPILEGRNSVRFQKGYAYGPISGGQDPSPLWDLIEPIVEGGLAMQNVGAQLPVTPANFNLYYLKTVWATSIVDFPGSSFVDPPSNPLTADGFFVTELSFFLNGIPEIVKAPTDGAFSETQELKYILVASVDTRVNPPILRSYPESHFNLTRPHITGITNTGAGPYVPTIS